MSVQIRICGARNWRPANEQAGRLLSACAHYYHSDAPMFCAGYNELCRLDLNGRSVLEVCSGDGALARGLAITFPGADVIALDRKPHERSAADPGNLRYHAGDALRLTEFADASFDLVCGQAALHHLAHDVTGLRDEYARVLKPGGRLVFIYEPLGHNPVCAMIRAYRSARHKLEDESSLFLETIQSIAPAFTACDVQVFNILAYPLKALRLLAPAFLVNGATRLDAVLVNRWPRLARLGANFNVVFTR